MTNVIGENIRMLRESMGFKQSNIADFLKVDQSLISKIENGERGLSSDMVEKLACLFGVTVSALETKEMKRTSLSFAFRASEMSEYDMETVSAINRIALNGEYMGKLLDD